ncbi:MAG TPA: hypothetical protein VK814_13560 [Acidobacteriaceae bacterium]|jgi:hypothetical protein|nr:hypothetical protein [Acidobacteriaceae bacterium]
MRPFLSTRNRTPRASFLALSASLALATLGLTGCAGVATMPDTVLPGASAQSAPLQGSVFGGHAPIVGAHVYVLQAGTTGYASAPTSLLTAGDGTDAHGTYVLTGPIGAFNITGEYACTSGHPVYLAAVGGSSTANPTITLTSATFTETGNSGKYTVTFQANNSLAIGQTVTFSGLTGGYAQLNGTTQTVIAPVTTTSFTIAFTGGHGSLHATESGAGFAVFNVSASLTNLVTLGNCPSSGNFSTPGNGAISFLYMNEVSTVATAFGFSGFGSSAFNIGAPATNLVGIQNAAVNAGQLYDIQGGNISTTLDGDDHIARATTPAGNGIVPQATLNTLADIISTCIDSSGTSSVQCTTLFQNATADGSATGAQPTDTATAAFNIAHFPGGSHANNAAFMTNLFALQSSGVVPFTPNLTSQPNDFSIAIEYPASSNADIGNPESIAIDGSGNIFFSNQSSHFITKLLPTGAVAVNFDAGETPGYLAIDPDGSPNTPANNNVWFGGINGGTPVDELSDAGTLKAHTTAPLVFTTVSAAAIDGRGNFYFVSATPQFDVFELTNTMLSTVNSPFSASNACIPSGDTFDHLAVDGAEQLWGSDEHGGVLCRFTTTGAAAPHFPVSLGGSSSPESIGIDANNGAWVSLESANEVDLVTIHAGNNQVNVNTLTSASTGATFSAPFSATIDGADNVWVTNRGNNTITELNNAGVAISPTLNYQSGTGILNDPLNAAIDPSGNVWITNYTGQEVVELVGAAAPTVTPLSFASGSNGLGAKP